MISSVPGLAAAIERIEALPSRELGDGMRRDILDLLPALFEEARGEWVAEVLRDAAIERALIAYQTEWAHSQNKRGEYVRANDRHRIALPAAIRAATNTEARGV